MPAALPPAKLDVLLGHLRRGVTLPSACDLAGMAVGKVRDYIRAAAPDGPDSRSGFERDVGEAILSALAEAEAGAIAVIHDAGQHFEELSTLEETQEGPEGTKKTKRTVRTNRRGDWRAAAWFLEHARRAAFGAAATSESFTAPPKAFIFPDMTPEREAALRTPLIDVSTKPPAPPEPPKRTP